MKKKILAVVLSAILALSFPTAMVAEAYYNLPLDVGNHHSHSGGSRSRSSGSRSSGSRSSGSGSGVNDPITAGIFIVIIAGVFIYGICKKTYHKTFSKNNMPYNANQQITEFMRVNDPNFITEGFLGWSKEIFVTLQTAWAQRDWEKIRTLEKEELFEQHNTQLQEYIRLGRINVIDEIKVLDAYLHKLVIDENFEHLIVSLRATMLDYIIDDKTKKAIIGNKKSYFDTIYMLTFTRRKGVKTNIVNGFVANICPHCGATVNSASSGKCEYCGSIIHTDEFNWVLSNLESVDVNFVNDNRGIVFLDGTNQY